MMTRAALLALFLMPHALRGQNGLHNPSFDTSIAGWSHLGLGVPSWDAANDAAGNPASGALLLSLAGHEGAIAMGQCVAIRPDTTFDFGTQAKLHHTGPVFPSAFIRIRFFHDTACTDATFDALVATPSLTPDPGWQLLTQTSAAPADVAGVALDFVLQPNGSPDPQGVDFDNAFLFGSGIQPVAIAIPSLSPSAVFTLVLLLALAGARAVWSSHAA